MSRSITEYRENSFEFYIKPYQYRAGYSVHIIQPRINKYCYLKVRLPNGSFCNSIEIALNIFIKIILNLLTK